MIKTVMYAVAALGIGAVPALAAEGNGNPFPFRAGSFQTQVVGPTADTGAAAYPHVSGRPGSDLPNLQAEILPTTGSEGIVQTANSLPVGGEEGTVAYAQAVRMRNWLLAHQLGGQPAVAANPRALPPG